MTYRKKILKNGLSLVTINGLSPNATTISAYVRAGFRFDPLGKPGLAHFCEHLTFSKTKNFPNSKAIAEAIEKYGGWHGAFTWLEHQSHNIRIPKERTQEGIEMLLECLFESIITDSNVGNEKGVVAEEILRNRSDPSRAIWDYVWFPLLFQGTSLARPYSGTKKDIFSMSKSDVVKFIENRFTPSNTVLFVAGDVDDKKIAEVIDKKLIKARPSLDKPISKIETRRKNRVKVHQDESYYQASVIVGVETVGFDSKDKYALDILQKILAGYFGSNLIQTLKDKGGLIYDWESFSDHIAETGYLLFKASCAPENIENVLSIVLKEFTRINKGRLNDSEINVAKGFITGSILANTETGQDYIDWYGLQELLSPENVLSIQEKIDIYKNVSKEDIFRVAKKYFSKDKILVGAIGKVKEDRILNLL